MNTDILVINIPPAIIAELRKIDMHKDIDVIRKLMVKLVDLAMELRNQQCDEQLDWGNADIYHEIATSDYLPKHDYISDARLYDILRKCATDILNALTINNMDNPYVVTAALNHFTICNQSIYK